MTLKAVLMLGLTLSGPALAAPQRYEMRSYVNVGGKMQPAFAWCDAPDRVLAVTQPASPSTGAMRQPTTLLRWLKRPSPQSDAATLTARYLLGPSQGAAGSIYTELSFPDGTGANGQFFIHTSNVENVNDPAYRMTHVNEFRTPEGSFRCRYQPQAAFMGATAKRTVIIWDNGRTATYATRNFDGTPGVYVTGGKRVPAGTEGGTHYEFPAKGGYTYYVNIDATGPGTGVVVGQDDRLNPDEPFLAYSISLPRKEQP